MRYVLGFMFDDCGATVVLIQKNKPTWQAGRWNGVGGKVEAGESPWTAMVREFQEEAGRATKERDWTHFANMRGDDFLVDCFKTFSSEDCHLSKTCTDERVHAFSIASLGGFPAVSNIQWLIQMALDADADPFFASIHYSDQDRLPVIVRPKFPQGEQRSAPSAMEQRILNQAEREIPDPILKEVT